MFLRQKEEGWRDAPTNGRRFGNRLSINTVRPEVWRTSFPYYGEGRRFGEPPFHTTVRAGELEVSPPY